MSPVVTTQTQVINVRLAVGGVGLHNVKVTLGTTVQELIEQYESDGRRLEPAEGQTMDIFVNGATVDESYELVDDNVMVILVGAIFNG